MIKGKILVVEDDEGMRIFVASALKKRGYTVSEAETGEGALEKIKEEPFDLIIMDVRLPGISGIEALDKIKEIDPQAIILIMTAYGKREMALEAIKKGAYDYFSKPFQIEEMEVIINRSLEKRRLEEEIRRLRRELARDHGASGLVFAGPQMERIYEVVGRVSPTDSTVLITGESGTGKELVADLIHNQSKRRDMPFIKLNCVAIPEGLLESELFGHEKGAFTGAYARRQGKFELAHKGTLFLDEIGDMSPPTQAKILRVLQEREFERVGGGKTIKVDVRIIAATNKDLKKKVAGGAFREDLYYRLNVVNIHLPPLRERRGDIPILAAHFLELKNMRTGRKIKDFSSDALDILINYPWPGNVRELKNTVERAVILTEGNIIDSTCLFMEDRNAGEIESLSGPS
ncbi:MAG: hypothetical protein DRH50_10655, partial [Deltaproteobacteria bacterium]